MDYVILFVYNLIFLADGIISYGDFFDGKIILFDKYLTIYDGYDSKETVLLIYALKKLGLKYLILINNSWSIDSNYNFGDIILCKSMVNISGVCGSNPLIGKDNDKIENKLTPMTDFADKTLYVLFY